MKTKYFKKELEKGGALTCPCGCNAKMSEETIKRLDDVREELNKPIYIEQGATCEKYSVKKVGRKKTSTHIDNGDGAIAVDIKKKTFKTKRDYFNFLSIAIRAGFTGIGQGSFWVGAGKNKRLHIDTRLNSNKDMRSWTYNVIV